MLQNIFGSASSHACWCWQLNVHKTTPCNTNNTIALLNSSTKAGNLQHHVYTRKVERPPSLIVSTPRAVRPVLHSSQLARGPRSLVGHNAKISCAGFMPFTTPRPSRRMRPEEAGGITLAACRILTSSQDWLTKPISQDACAQASPGRGRPGLTF